MKKRRGFLINSAVLLLLIPLILLAATYEDASSMIIHAQSENVELEKTFRLTSYLEEDFKNTLALSTKRALALSVDYVTSERPLDNASKALEELIINGDYPYIGDTPGWRYREEKFMKNNTIKDWLENMRWELKKQGYIMETSPEQIIKNIKLTIVPLDSFHIVINATIPHIVIRDISGTVVYNSSIPSKGSLYVVIPINGIEDPLFPYLTKGRMSRIVSACNFAYPSITPPYKLVYGYGRSNIKAFSAPLYNMLKVNSIFYGDRYIEENNALGYILRDEPSSEPNAPYIFNISTGGSRISPLNVFSQGDMGVMVFDSVESTGTSSSNWCVKGAEYRVNMTLPSDTPQDSLVLLELNPSNVPFGSALHNGRAAAIRIYKRSSTSCQIAPYWIEYWGKDRILIWLNTTNTKEYTVYYSTTNSSLEWGGDITVFPVYNTSVELKAGTEKSELLSNIPWKSFFVRYSLKAVSNSSDFDSGVEVRYNSSKCLLVLKSISQSIFSSAPKNIQIPIYLSAKNISDLNAQWTKNKAAITITDVNGNKVPFWIEYWNSNGALIWVKANLTDDESLLEKFLKTIYGIMPSFVQNWMNLLFGWLSDYYYNAFLICPTNGPPTRGDGNKVFEFFDDFNGSSLDTEKWNVKTTFTGGYTVSDGILTLKGDNSYKNPADVWLWTKKTFPYYSYVVGLGVKISSSADQGWLWYIDSTGEGWMEYIYPNRNGRTKGHLYSFNVSSGYKYNEKVRGGKYTANSWTHVEIAIEDWYDLSGDHYADITTYQNQSGPFTGTWSGNTSAVSGYTVYPAENDTAIGLAQFMGSTQYNFVYVRKYLNLNDLDQSSIFVTKQNKVEFIDDNPGHEDHGGDKLAILNNWSDNLAHTTGTWYMGVKHRYEVIVDGSSNGINLDFTYNPDITPSSRSSASIEGVPGGYTLYVTIDNKEGNNAYFDWIVAAPYPYKVYTDADITFTSSESIGRVNGYSTARVYDLQPFIDCVQNQKYFGVYGAPSFFERLEGGSTVNRAYYEAMAEKMQKVIYGSVKYPIGLVSFILPKELPPNLNFLVRKQPAADYIYLDYKEYPSDDPNAYKVLGISSNGGVTSPIIDENFYLTPEIARMIFGVQGSKDLLVR
ncbi:DUF2341 domain-containing protein [Thermococcus sp.]